MAVTDTGFDIVFDLKPILFVIGILLSILALSMLVPAILDAAVGNPDWVVFVASALVTLFAGVSLVLTTRTAGPRAISVRQAFLLTALSWLAVASFAALPFAFASRDIGYVGAFFEAMSGLTTTGATVLTGLDGLPPGILFWRALLQWMGGIGIIVTSVAVLPMLRIGGMQLFRTESSDTSEKILPRATQLAGAIGRVYVGLTAACALALWAAGMTGFDAITHAMTTLSTGGFSTRDASISAFDNPIIEVIVVGFMILGALPFVLYIRWMHRERMALWQDSQVRAFLAMLAVVWIVLTGWLVLSNGVPVLTALRLAAFNSTSVITTTGFATGDYGAWGPLPVMLFFWMLFVGGCTGSTSGGFKIFRLHILYAAARKHINQLVHPNAVVVPTFNRRPVPEGILMSVMSFFFLFVATFLGLTLILGLLGLDYVTAISGAATAIANVGPGLGPIIGPAGNFQSLSDPAKLVLAAGMLLGRLELFTIMVLFTRAYWRG